MRRAYHQDNELDNLRCVSNAIPWAGIRTDLLDRMHRDFYILKSRRMSDRFEANSGLVEFGFFDDKTLSQYPLDMLYVAVQCRISVVEYKGALKALSCHES